MKQPAAATETAKGRAPETGSAALPPEAGAVERGQASAEASLELLQAQLAEQAQTKVESNSRLPVKIFGTVVFNAFFNSGEANWLDIPNLVNAPPGSSLPRGSFSATLRQSRLGAIVEGPSLGSVRTRGFVAMDFFGGIPNFQTGPVIGLPRLLYAFVRLEGERTALAMGQDHMILAPRNPTSLAAMAFPNFYRSGNLYLRVPQVRVEHRIATRAEGEFELTAGILAPLAGEFLGAYEFAPSNLAGERSRQPGVQARLAWRSRPAGLGADRGLELAVSGHTGGAHFLSGSQRSWAAAVDFDARSGRFGLGGEWFVGRNLAAFGGSLGQFARSTGGYVEGRFHATERLELNAGFGLDHLFDLESAPLLDKNSGVFTNFIYHLTPEWATSVEYRWLSTRPAGLPAERNHHVNVVFAYSF